MKKRRTLITRSLLYRFLNSTTGSFIATEAHKSPIGILCGEDRAEQNIFVRQLIKWNLYRQVELICITESKQTTWQYPL